MKIAVTSKGENLESEVDPRFGRCKNFIIVDLDTMEYEVKKNEQAQLGGGAGIQTARFITEQGIKTILTGNVGPKAFRTLSAAGVNIYIGADGAIKQAVEKFKAGEYSKIKGPNVRGHFGSQM